VICPRLLRGAARMTLGRGWLLQPRDRGDARAGRCIQTGVLPGGPVCSLHACVRPSHTRSLRACAGPSHTHRPSWCALCHASESAARSL
jgi:hypothetical protein